MLIVWIALAGCAPHVPPAPAAAVREAQARVDWAAAGDEAARVLSGYLQIDTSNPPGNETAGAEYLGAILTAEGIPWEISEYAPGRGSLVARLEGGEQPPLCLLSHIDVATVEAERWSQPPFSGAIVDGEIWGRGALDMKGVGVVELMAMVLLKRQGIRLDRDVVLLAVADEEMDNTGARELAKRWDTIGCSHVVNEGGMGVQDAFLDGQTIYPISVAEKGWLWVRMVAHGAPGHGSTPKPDEAPDRLLRALERLESRDVRPEISAPMLELFRRAGEESGGATGFVLKHPALVRTFVRGRLLANPVTRAAITDTVHVTGFGGAEAPNVVPSEAWAVLDCRLLPGHLPQDLLAELVALVDDPQVTFEVISQAPSEVSPWEGDPLFDAMERAFVEGRPGVVVGPFVSIGSTDSGYLRPLGVRAYGIAPFEVTYEDLATMHGDDERVSVEALRDGVRRFYGALVDYAGRME